MARPSEPLFPACADGAPTRRVLESLQRWHKANASLTGLVREVYPIGTRVVVWPRGPGPLHVVGTVANYMEPLSAGLVLRFAPDDVRHFAAFELVRGSQDLVTVRFHCIIGTYKDPASDPTHA